MVLTWEDGYCQMDASGGLVANERQSLPKKGSIDGNMLGMAVAKMSYHVYSYGEGVVGRVAFSGKHQWVFAPRPVNAGGVASIKSFGGFAGGDKYPSGWDDQFAAGVKTIAIIAVPEGVIQLGSLNSMQEDLKFVSHVRSAFTALQAVPGAFLSDLFFDNPDNSTNHPASDMPNLVAPVLPADIAAALGDCGLQGDFRDTSFSGTLNNTPSMPYMLTQSKNLGLNMPTSSPAANVPLDLFGLLDTSPGSLQRSATLQASNQVAAVPNMQGHTKRQRMNLERQSVAIDQIQLNFFDAKGMLPMDAPPKPRQMRRPAPLSESSAHVLTPSGELLGGSRTKVVVDLEQELRKFHENCMQDPNALAMLGQTAVPHAGLAPRSNPPHPPAAAAAASNAQGRFPTLEDQLLLPFSASDMLPLMFPEGAKASVTSSNFGAAGFDSLNLPGGLGDANELAQALGLQFTGLMPSGVQGVAGATANRRGLMEMEQSVMSGLPSGKGQNKRVSEFPLVPPSMESVIARAGAVGGRFQGAESARPSTAVACTDGNGRSGEQPRNSTTNSTGGGINRSLADSECMAKVEALMRTSGMLPSYSLAELQKGGNNFSSAAVGSAIPPATTSQAALQGVDTSNRSSAIFRQPTPAVAMDAQSILKGSAAAAQFVEQSRKASKGAAAVPQKTEAVVFEAGQDAFDQEVGAAMKDDKKLSKKRGRGEDKPKQRPRDRQLIQDRVKDLRGLVPKSERLSIDGLLERTIQHLLFLRQYSSLQADIYKGQAQMGKTRDSDISARSPVSVHHLSATLLEIKVELLGDAVPIDLADTLRQMGLIVRKSSIKAIGGVIRAEIVVEAKEGTERMEVMWNVLHHLNERLPQLGDGETAAEIENGASGQELEEMLETGVASHQQQMTRMGVISV